MAKDGVRVTKDQGGFRIIIPFKIIKKMRWQDVTRITVDTIGKDMLVIRRLFDKKNDRRIDSGD